MFKRYVSAGLAALMLWSVAQASTPRTQFYYQGWPYQQEANTPSKPSAPTKETTAPTSQPITAPGASLAPTKTAEAAHPSTPVPTVMPTAKPAVTKAPPTVDDYTTESLSAQEQKAWNLLNADRKSNGLSSLTLDPELSRIARIKSNDMRDNHYFAHESPTYGDVRAMLRQFGYTFAGAGENIAHHATVERSQIAFMSSTGHRRNILSTAWTKVGVGVAYDARGFVYVTQIFAR